MGIEFSGVALKAKYLLGQMYLTCHLSGVVSPVITGDKANQVWKK